MEWVDKLFSERISSYRGLALFLIEKMYVDTQSAAAQALAASVAREHEVIDGGTFIFTEGRSNNNSLISDTLSPFRSQPEAYRGW